MNAFTVSLSRDALALIEIIPDCVSVLDFDGAVIAINAVGLQQFDIDDRTWLGRRWLAWWPPEIQTHVEKGLSEARSGRKGHFFGYCPTAKGAPKWWHVSVTPLLDECGRVSSLLCIARDITNALRSAETRLRALADNIPQLAWLADGSGWVFWCNKRWYEYTGTTPEEVAGLGWKKCHHPDHIDRVLKKFLDCMRTGEAWEDTFPLKSATGEYRWFLSRAMPSYSKNGSVVLWCGTNTDITAEKEATARLQRKARLIELSHEAILAWDLDGQIITWNKGCEELYGFSRAEAIGARSHDLLKRRLPNHWDEFEALLRRERAWSGELIQISKEGSEMWVDCRMEVMEIDGREIVLETNRDVTERHEAEATRELLIGELHHRIKNTLATIQSIATQTARNSKDMRSFLDSFEGRLRSIAATHGVLTESDWTGARLGDLIETELRASIDDTSRISVRGENVLLAPQTALHLALILHELAVNALKYGSLSVSQGRVQVEWERPKEGGEITLLWKEIGGPQVEPPSSRGFGATLIERSQALPQLSVDMRYPEDGVECLLTVTVAGEEAQKLFCMRGVRQGYNLRSATSSIR
jgi:PAS domain S-box-containing protein